MANFFVPQGEDQAIFQMTMDPIGSGSTKPFLHPWKLNLYINQLVSIGLYDGYNRAGIPLRVTSNATEIADHPPDKLQPVPRNDRILSLTGKAKGITMLEVRDGDAGERWCFLQVEVKQRPGLAQGWIGPMGDAAFNQKVFEHLRILKTSQSFQEMWDLTLQTGYRVTIKSNSFNDTTLPDSA
jgi:hypothetical protein